jgi:hypothetical protein
MRRDALVQEDQGQRHNPDRRRVGQDRGAAGRDPGNGLVGECKIKTELANADRNQRGKILPNRNAQSPAHGENGSDRCP